MTFLIELKSGIVLEGRTYPTRYGSKVFLNNKEFKDSKEMRESFQTSDPIVYELWGNNLDENSKQIN